MTQQTFKWLKRLSLVLAIIPILLFLAFAGAVSLIDFNQYKPQIEKEIGQLTNRELKIEGAVDVSVLPFMFHIGQLNMKNPQGFEEGNMLTLKEAHVELSLKKLFLDKKLEIISLELIEPKMAFIDHGSSNNWQDIPLLAGLMEKIQPFHHVSNAHHFDKQYLIKSVHQSSMPKLQKVATPVESATLESQEPWYLESLVIQDAQITYKHTQQDFSATISQADLMTFDVRPGQPFKVNTSFIYEHSQSPRKMDFDVNGVLNLSEDYSQLTLQDWHGVFRLQLPVERNLPDIRLSTSGKHLLVDFKHQQIYVKDVELKGLESEVQTSFQGEFGVNPVFQGVFAAKRINIKNWIEHLGLPAPQMQQEQALSNAGGKFDFQWDGKVLKLEQIDAKVDETKIEGEIVVPLSDKTAAYRFALKLENFNADDYIALGPNGEKFYPVPMAFLQGLKAQGDLQIRHGQLAGISADDMQLSLYANQGNLELAPLDLFISQGKIESKLAMQLHNNKQSFQWNGKSENLPLAAMTKEVGFQSSKLNSRFNLSTQGLQVEQWKANLQGSLQMEIQDITLQGLAVDQWLQGEWSLTKKPQTQLHELNAVGSFNAGVFVPKRLLIEGRGFSGTGITEIDLVNEQLNGEFNMLVKPDEENIQALQGLRLPLLLSGSFSEQNWSVDFASMDQRYIEQHAWLQALQSILQ